MGTPTLGDVQGILRSSNQREALVVANGEFFRLDLRGSAVEHEGSLPAGDGFGNQPLSPTSTGWAWDKVPVQLELEDGGSTVRVSSDWGHHETAIPLIFPFPAAETEDLPVRSSTAPKWSVSLLPRLVQADRRHGTLRSIAAVTSEDDGVWQVGWETTDRVICAALTDDGRRLRVATATEIASVDTSSLLEVEDK